MDPKHNLLAIIVLESQGLPTMKCQTKCAKAIFVRLFKHHPGPKRPSNPIATRQQILYNKGPEHKKGTPNRTNTQQQKSHRQTNKILTLVI